MSSTSDSCAPSLTRNDREDVQDSLSARSNAGRLHAELLAVVFRLAAETTAGRLMVSVVCAHWRACALDDASLWADLTNHRLRVKFALPQFQLALTRTKSAPLSVCLNDFD